MAQQTVTLAPNESQVVSFQTVPTEARVYQVSVNGLTSSFVATTLPPQPPPVEVTPNNPIVGLVPETVVSGGEFPVTIWFWLDQKPATLYIIDVIMSNQYWGQGYFSLQYSEAPPGPWILLLDHTGVYTHTGMMKAIGTGPWDSTRPKPPGVYPVYCSGRDYAIVSLPGGGVGYQLRRYLWENVVIGEIEVTS